MGFSPSEKNAPKQQGPIPNNASATRSNLPVSIAIMNAQQDDRKQSQDDPALEKGAVAGSTASAVIDTKEHAAHLDQNVPFEASSRPRTPESLVADTRPSPRKIPFSTALLRKLPSAGHKSHPPSPGADSVPISTPRSASMRSLQLSDDETSNDEGASQAVASSADEEETGQRSEEPDLTTFSPDPAPQLIMPNLMTISSRRPFTERGQHIGKLKIMVTGRKRLGKTSLIKSMVQNCEDIVHLDPVAPYSLRLSTEVSNSRRVSDYSKRSERNWTMEEIAASTRAYPSWMAEAEGNSRILRLSRGSDDTVLERNICFIDTPGYDSTSSTSFQQFSTFVLQHIEQQLHRNASLASMSDSDLLGIFSGGGGAQVDAVLYLLTGREELNQHEIELLRTISQQSNLIPVLAKSDTYDIGELYRTKLDLYERLERGGVEMIDIASLTGPKGASGQSQGLMTVSCAPARDYETIDASLLMSSMYVQPLQPSDLLLLTESLFDPENVACLRHSALRKFISWKRQRKFHTPSMSISSLQNPRRTMPPLAMPTFNASSTSSISANSVIDSTLSNAIVIDRGRSAAQSDSLGEPASDDVSSQSSFHPPYSPDAYTVARVLDHTQREERMAQVRLARWAADLQRALRNERARFAALKEAERTTWLQERLEESIDVEMDDEEKKRVLIRKHSNAADQVQRDRMRADDPLGLFEWRAQLSQRGVMVAKMVGGAGIVGAVVVWVMRTWGWGLDLVPDSSSVRGPSDGVTAWWWARE